MHAPRSVVKCLVADGIVRLLWSALRIKEAAHKWQYADMSGHGFQRQRILQTEVVIETDVT